MSTTTPPADNMYKWLAATGLLVFILSCATVYCSLISKQSRAAELEGLMRAAEALEKIADEAPDDSQRQQTAQARSDELIAEVAQKAHEVERGQTRGVVVAIFMVLVAIAGAGLCVCSFRLWYLRIQRYQDIIVRAQADRDELDVDNQSEPSS